MHDRVYGRAAWTTETNSTQLAKHSDNSCRKITYPGEMEKYLAGSVAAASITPRQRWYHSIPEGETEGGPTPDAMDKGLEEDIIKNIPERVSEL